MNGAKLRELAQAYPLQAFGEHEQALVGHFHDFVHDRRGADGVKIAGLRRIDARFALRHHDDGLVFAEGIDQLDRAFPAHGQRQNGMREQNGVPYREHRERPLLRLFPYF